MSITRSPKKTVQLISDWKWVVRKAWSMKLSIAAALLSGAEAFVQMVTPIAPSGAFAAAAAAVSIAAAVARVVAQRPQL